MPFYSKSFAHQSVLLPAIALSTLLLLGGCNSAADASAQKNTETGSPKNVILFIGDGMGVSTVTAARIFDGQSKGKSGEEHSLAFEAFDNLALIKTYNTNAQVPDSAGTATAILSGYKTNIGAVNVKPNVDETVMVKEACTDKASPPTLTKVAKAKGKAVGVISTARLTHATPAAMYSHSVSRSWETDKDIKDAMAVAGCTSIAQQLVESDVDLALGGGRKEFTDAHIQSWTDQGHIYVADFADLSDSPADQRILGLFNSSHMSFEADRAETNEPSLADMTTLAINRLSQDEDGYVLMVEAGRVDHAHHGTNAYRAMRDMQALNEAVQAALAQAGDDTLIMVTADHSHVFTMSGYPMRGNPIMGLVKRPDSEDYELAKDGKPYTTLGYHNGSNQRTADSVPLTDNMVQDPDYRQETAIPLGSETHAGEDVPLYATGPGSEKVRGTMEQDEIGRLIREVLALN
ncbi:alkaline phosphatase [Litorimonas sp. RW-G-Af-16]|uniref:alkaline phosphatase n=1 Tax=Litorimonas sp. RW-G-Af-16 TaxID=3241168 RepID=UPI00390CA6EC